ncbi:MAG: terminase family protein [Verrucomicrobiota bacterium]|jgi:phage FluMu gp28-like protein
MTITANLRKKLLPYQQKWVDDSSRWKFGLMARQVGKDFSAAYEGILDCIQAEASRKPTTWLIAAPSERQSLESLEKWKSWANTFNAAIHNYHENRDGGPEALLHSATITFPKGSRVIAVPGKPDTVRGYSANVLLSEFAFFENPDATWRAILPAITNPLRGGVKKVRLITTPNGIGNKAHDLWIKNYKRISEVRISESVNAGGKLTAPLNKSLIQTSTISPIWSCHFVPIREAVRNGLDIHIPDLKSALDDPDGWDQEFECLFLDAQSILLPYDLIAQCESLDATAFCPPDFWETSVNANLKMGIDFGRKRNLTVAWTTATVGDVEHTVEVLELSKTPTQDQVDILSRRIRRVHRVCFDYTGPGIGLGDYLVKLFGQWNPPQHKFGKIELLSFTAPVKCALFANLRDAFAKHKLRIPVSRAIREDLHSVVLVCSNSGYVSYRAAHTDDGHADRCTALALAWRAATNLCATVSVAGININPHHALYGDGWPYPLGIIPTAAHFEEERMRDRHYVPQKPNSDFL